MRRVALLLALPVAIACRGPGPGSSAPRAPELGVTSHEAYTTTRTVLVGGEERGYLVSYDPVPLHAQGEVQRSLPEGTHRILDPEFHDVGFITPRFEVRRYDEHGGSVALGACHSLEEGLGMFFGGAASLAPLAAGTPTGAR